MTIRIFLLLTALFIGVMWLSAALQLPVDGFLAALFVSAMGIVVVFAHYRHIGRQRARGLTDKALWNLSLWRFLLPPETFHQFRLQILVESEDPQRARKALEQAEQDNLLAPAFLLGFHAELERRQRNYKRARRFLQEGIQETPPGLLLAGLHAQLSRLYIHNLCSPERLEEVKDLLDEAEEFVDTHIHGLLIKAVRGEYHFAREEYEEAIELLQSSMDQLLADHPPPPGAKGTFFQYSYHFLMNLFAQLTYSQQDEHQNPFYAELCHTLGRAYLATQQYDKASLTLNSALALCQQPFVADPIQKSLRKLPSA